MKNATFPDASFYLLVCKRNVALGAASNYDFTTSFSSVSASPSVVINTSLWLQALISAESFLSCLVLDDTCGRTLHNKEEEIKRVCADSVNVYCVKVYTSTFLWRQTKRWKE